MGGFDFLENREMFARRRGSQERFEPIGDARKRRMHDHGTQAGRDPSANHVGDFLPIGDAGDARAAKLEHYPRLTIFEHSGDYLCQ